MIATNEEEGKLEAKPLWCDDCGDTYDREHRELVKDSDGRIRCHRPWLYCTACRDSFRPSAPVADEENAWEIHACAPCKHCGAPKPESTEGGRRVSVLRRQEGVPVLLG